MVSDLGFLGTGSLHELGGSVWASVGVTVLTMMSALLLERLSATCRAVLPTTG